MMARDLFNKGKLNECIEMVGKIVRDQDGNVKKESAAAAQASALGVAAALNLYVEAPDDQKPAALERLMKVAEFTEKNWPDKPEADDARMARGQAKLVVGQVREAIDVFDRVNPKSERYATAMYWAGQNYWRLYVTAKLGSPSAPDKDQMAADRAKAVERLTTALNILQRELEPGRPLPKYMLETQLLLAEVYNEGGDAKQAAALYQPLVDLVKAEKPQAFDANTIRIFLGAVRAYCALNDLDKAGAVSGVLIELGPDTLPINDVLVEFAKLLNLERKKAEARVTELANSANADEVDAAGKRLASVQELLGKTLVKLSERKELGLGHMMFIGETLNAIGMTAEASRAVPENPQTHGNRRGVRRPRQEGHEPAAHRAAQGAPQAREVRRSPQTGGPVDQGEPQRLGAADGEGPHSRSLGGEGPGQVRRGRGPLGHAPKPAARDAEEAGRILRSDVQRRQVSGARGRKEQGQGEDRRLCEEGRAGAQVAPDPQPQAQRPRHGGQVQSAAEQGHRLAGKIARCEGREEAVSKSPSEDGGPRAMPRC